MVRCDECNLNFISAQSLAVHKKNRHKQKVIIKCPKCKLRFSRQTYFRMHWNNKHEMAVPDESPTLEISESDASVSEASIYRRTVHIFEAFFELIQRPNLF